MQTADVLSASSKHGDGKLRAGILALSCSHACCMPHAPGSSIPAPALTAHPTTAPAPATSTAPLCAQQCPWQQCQASPGEAPTAPQTTATRFSPLPMPSLSSCIWGLRVCTPFGVCSIGMAQGLHPGKVRISSLLRIETS